MKTYTLHRRTFEARKYPKESPERAALNLDVVTSEYLSSQKYVIRTPALMSDGTPNPAQQFHYTPFATKTEAEAALKFLTRFGQPNDSTTP